MYTGERKIYIRRLQDAKAKRLYRSVSHHSDTTLLSKAAGRVYRPALASSDADLSAHGARRAVARRHKQLLRHDSLSRSLDDVTAHYCDAPAPKRLRRFPAEPVFRIPRPCSVHEFYTRAAVDQPPAVEQPPARPAADLGQERTFSQAVTQAVHKQCAPIEHTAKPVHALPVHDAEALGVSDKSGTGSSTHGSWASSDRLRVTDACAHSAINTDLVVFSLDAAAAAHNAALESVSLRGSGDNSEQTCFSGVPRQSAASVSRSQDSVSRSRDIPMSSGPCAEAFEPYEPSLYTGRGRRRQQAVNNVPVQYAHDARVQRVKKAVTCEALDVLRLWRDAAESGLVGGADNNYTLPGALQQLAGRGLAAGKHATPPAAPAQWREGADHTTLFQQSVDVIDSRAADGGHGKPSRNGGWTVERRDFDDIDKGRDLAYKDKGCDLSWKHEGRDLRRREPSGFCDKDDWLEFDCGGLICV